MAQQTPHAGFLDVVFRVDDVPHEAVGAVHVEAENDGDVVMEGEFPGIPVENLANSVYAYYA